MNQSEPVTLKRDCEASIVPMGHKVVLQAGEKAHITQALGGVYTVVVNGNMFRIEARDADALGFEQVDPGAGAAAAPLTGEALEKEVWDQMRTCYDPEIPVNIVDLGLIYDCKISAAGESGSRVEVKMTLTAPGCGMGPVLQQDVQNKLLMLPGVEEAEVELVWDPPWNQGMMSEAAQLQLGLM
jgi:probable FeS assembly SUF system protein SufT